MSLVYSESNVLIEIEQFIDYVLSQDIANCHEATFIQQVYELNNGLSAIYNANHVYSAKVNAFTAAFQVCRENHPLKSFAQCFQEAVSFYQESIMCDIHNNMSQESNNRNSLITYVSELTQHYSRLLFVRVDLSYPINEQHLATIALMHSHITKLLTITGNKSRCFKHLQGYAWALEQGLNKGYHCHLLLMFDGNQHQSDWFKGQQVGYIWKEITNNKGCYFSCNSTEYKDRYARMGKIGIGMIHRDNPVEVQNAIDTASYLVNPEKSDQFLRVKTSKRMRTFGKGVYAKPKRRGIKPVVQLA